MKKRAYWLSDTNKQRVAVERLKRESAPADMDEACGRDMQIMAAEGMMARSCPATIEDAVHQLGFVFDILAGGRIDDPAARTAAEMAMRRSLRFLAAEARIDADELTKADLLAEDAVMRRYRETSEMLASDLAAVTETEQAVDAEIARIFGKGAPDQRAP